ncbi:MAG TPA: thermonuclease family protein [Solirubrobacterales bacterium]
MSGGRVGSAVLLVVVALLILRPWEGGTDRGGPAETAAVVVRVVDGDTVEIEFDGERQDLRLIGVDTPETVKPGAPVECFGRQASNFTHRSLEGRRVNVVFGVERTDSYGRLLGYLRVEGRLFNAELLRRGLARTLTIPPNDRLAPLFERLALTAARAGRGLWGACDA